MERTPGTGHTTRTPFDSTIAHVPTVKDGLPAGFDAFFGDQPIAAAISATPAQS
ncbi:hypothetical protein ACWDGI_20135 [Streptomyces sp. NPDC001220]